MSSAIITIIIFVVGIIINGAAKEAGNSKNRRPVPPRMQPQRYYTNPPQPQRRAEDNAGGSLYREKRESFFDDTDYTDTEGEELDKRYPGSLRYGGKEGDELDRQYPGSLRYENDPEGTFTGNLAFSSKEGLESKDEGEDNNAYGVENGIYRASEEDVFGITFDDMQKSIIMAEILGRPKALRKYGRQ